MRVAIAFPLALGVPGGGTQDCVELSLHLKRQGVDVVVLSVASAGPSGWPRPRVSEAHAGAERIARLEAEGIEVRSVDPHPVHRMLDGLPMRRAVRRLIAEGPLDALLGWGHEVRFVADLLRRRGVLFASNAAASYAPILGPQGRWRGRLRRWRGQTFIATPLRQAEVVFVRSEFSRGEVARLAGVDPARICVAPCGVDPSFAQIARAEETATEPVTRLLYFGLFTFSKGVFDALHALGRVARGTRSDWTLRVAGWGNEDAVRRVAAEAGIADRVELIGALDRAGLIEALSWAQVAVLPSYTESFGLANAEAQAAGIPVVGYAAGAVPEMIVSGETGWLAPLCDVAGLTTALEAALEDPVRTRRFGLAGRARVTRLYRWERSATLTRERLERALEARRSGVFAAG